MPQVANPRHGIAQRNKNKNPPKQRKSYKVFRANQNHRVEIVHILTYWEGQGLKWMDASASCRSGVSLDLITRNVPLKSVANS